MNIELLPLSSFSIDSLFSIIYNAYSLHPARAIPLSVLEHLKELYNDNNIDKHGFVACLDVPVGLALWEFSDIPGDASLLLFCVDKEFQTQGIGSAILSEAVTKLASMGIKQIFAECNERFSIAHRLLDRNNFGYIGLYKELIGVDYLGYRIKYLHTVGKKLCRPRKRRKKGEVLI